MVMLKMKEGVKIEKIEPNKELMEFTRKILEQNAVILRMNEQLLERLNTPILYTDFGKKDLRDLNEQVKEK